MRASTRLRCLHRITKSRIAQPRDTITVVDGSGVLAGTVRTSDIAYRGKTPGACDPVAIHRPSEWVSEVKRDKGDAVEFLNEREFAGDELRNTLKLHNSVNLKPATRGPHLHQTAPFPVTSGINHRQGADDNITDRRLVTSNRE